MAEEHTDPGVGVPDTFAGIEHAVEQDETVSLRIDNDRVLQCQQLLRHLPGRRLVLAGHMGDQPVVAKFFSSRGKAAREFARELSTLRQLSEKDLPVPEPIFHTVHPGWRCFVMPEIEGVPGGRVYREGQMEPEQLQRRLAGLVARLFRAGFVQTDLHLDNFVLAGEQFHILDAGSIGSRLPFPLAAGQWRRILARLLIQFYPVDVQSRVVTDLDRELNVAGNLEKTVASLRRRRLNALVRKPFRNSARYAVVDESAMTGMVMRSRKEPLRVLLNQDMNVNIRNAETIKAGNSATVVRYCSGDTDWVIKRYNAKGTMTALKRCLFSRARRSWRNALWLEFNGLATPPPVAFLREKGRGLRAREYYISEHVPGPLLKSLSAKELISDERILHQLSAIFTVMRAPGFVHGDFKAANFLVDDHHRLHLLDLDAMRPCRPTAGQRKKVKADRERLLRNWPEEYRSRIGLAVGG